MKLRSILLLLLLSSSTSAASPLGPLALAIQRGDLKEFNAILVASPDSARSEDIQKRTALHHATRWASIEHGAAHRLAMVEKLTSISNAGSIEIDVNQVDTFGKTALHIAAEHSYPEGPGVAMMKHLIKSGADMNIQDKKGLTPLMLAAIKGFEKAGVFLVESGARLDIKSNHNEYSAFLYASRKGRMHIVRALLSKGIDHKQRCSYGNTGFHLAEFAGHKEVADFIRKHVGDDFITSSVMNAEEEKMWEKYPKGAKERTEGPMGGEEKERGSGAQSMQ